MLIGKLEMAKALTRKVEGAVNAHSLLPSLAAFRLRDVVASMIGSDGRGLLAARRRPALPDQQRQPIAASAQALKQRDIRNIGKPIAVAQAAVERSPRSPRQ